MSVYRHSCIDSLVHEFLYSVEVHVTVVAYNRSMLHGIARSHLIEVRNSHQIFLTVLNESAGSDACSQLEVGRGCTVHIVLQYVILLEVLVLLKISRLFNREFLHLIDSTRYKTCESGCKK